MEVLLFPVEVGSQETRLQLVLNMWPTDSRTFLARWMGLADPEVGGMRRALGVRHQLCHCDNGGMDEDMKTETFASIESCFDKGRLMGDASSDASPFRVFRTFQRHRISSAFCWEILLGPRTPDWNITMFSKHSGSTPVPGAWMQCRCWSSSWRLGTQHPTKTRAADIKIESAKSGCQRLNVDDSRREDSSL
jgi:hypothetical protein